MRQMCDQLGLKFGQTAQVANAIRKRDGVTNLSDEQLSDAMKKA